MRFVHTIPTKEANMKEYETLRIYTNRPCTKTAIANDYYEIPYVEIRWDGTIKARGTEDFSYKRYWDTVDSGWIWTWDGERRNKGGYRWFDCIGLFHFTKGRNARKIFKDYIRHSYSAPVVEIR